MRNSKNRIGFILDSIHKGSGQKLWGDLVAGASKDDCAFFVFPGGKLENKESSEGKRNKIFSLANSKNLDGVICWSSAIGSSVSRQELEKFHKTFEDLPFVTIGEKIGDHPAIKFSAYSGMKELVLHFVKSHGAKKIAFIRGPKNHSSAEDRFKAFNDALLECGITPDKNLISDSFGFYEGGKAVNQLFEERGLVPGKDFDAIVAASDLMIFEGVKALKQKGFLPPKDYLAGGFNDTIESRVFEPNISTVRMPYEELAQESLKLLKQIFHGKNEVSDFEIVTHPVFRESCGCISFGQDMFLENSKTIKSRKQLHDEIAKLFRLQTEKTRRNLGSLIDLLVDGSERDFSENLEKILIKYFSNDIELHYLMKALVLLKNSNFLEEERLRRVVFASGVSIARIQEKVAVMKRYKESVVYSAMNNTKNSLLSVSDRDGLVQTLKFGLQKIGVNNLAIVLYENEKASRYVGGFKDLNSYKKEILFSSDLIVPDEISGNFERGTFVVQPLFDESHSIGYIVINYSDFGGIVYEDLRASVSNALKSIFMFEEINEAKKVAEKAEFERTEFFANVGSDLCDPLKDLSAKLSQMENNVNEGLSDPDILSEQLIFLRSQIDAQLEKTSTLVELTRSQVDDLPMDKKLFNIRQILPGSAAIKITKEMPLLYGDAGRLAKALGSLSEVCDSDIVLEEKVDGVHILLNALKIDWQKPEILLAEKIILLQYGDLLKTESSAEIILPWPNLAGVPSSYYCDDQSEIYTFSENIEKEKFFGKRVKSFTEADFDDSGKNLLVWNPDSAPIDEWVKIYSLRKNDSVYNTPLLCFSRTLVGHNFLEILEEKVKNQQTTTVLFVDAKHTKYGTWATETNSVVIHSMDEFESILEEITPTLIVFESIDEVSIVRIRQNQKTVLTPIIVLPDSILSESEVELLCSHPRIILCNRGAADSEQFDVRVQEILSGDEILPPHTGALVKKAILYLNKNASQQIVRWKLADTVHVSEDYLTRIFHKEIGLSLWEYLNRYRIYLATKMLLETNDTIYEIAEKSGFQDQAYFCRVFKKIYGVPPGKIRTK